MVELLLSSETLEVRIVVISWGIVLGMGCERTSEGVGIFFMILGTGYADLFSR